MIVLVGHVHAGADELRPISPRRGQRAGGLVEQLRGVPLSAVIASPALSCVQTVEELALARGVQLRLDERLRPQAPIGPLLALAADEDAVLCTHGDVVRRVLDRLRRLGAVLPRDVECRTDATWMIDLPHEAPPRAVYLPPVRALPHAG